MKHSISRHVKEFLKKNPKLTDSEIRNIVSFNLKIELKTSAITKMRQRMGLKKSPNGRPRLTQQEENMSLYDNETRELLNEVAMIAEQNRQAKAAQG